MKKKLSIVTIAKNEESHIGKFLESVKWVDEIIIVDNGSNDKTIELAKKYTNKVFSSKGTNLGPLKQLALSKTTGNWILIIISSILIILGLIISWEWVKIIRKKYF